MSQAPRSLLLLDLHSGISGDMFVAAAAGLAACEAEVLALPRVLGLHGVHCEFSTVKRGGIQCRKFDVIDEHEHPHHHHHPHEHEHGHAHTHEHGHEHCHEHSHEHGEGHCHEHHHAHDHEEEHEHPHHHEHRALSDILDLISSSTLPAGVITRASRMFRLLGEVEAEAHGIPVESVHFHEVGAIDSIVDIVASALCIERLAPAAVHASVICVGKGTVRCAHGRLPVPAPATEKLLQGMPIQPGELPGEWTTPTGALILRELAPRFDDPTCVVRTSAFGGGTKDSQARPNLLRLRLATEHRANAQGAHAATDAAHPSHAHAAHPSSTTSGASATATGETLVTLLTNLDNTTGELLGADFLEHLLHAGARDAVLHPIIMKKGRPGLQLEVLALPADADRLAELVFTHTTTIGIRLASSSRLALPREAVTVETPFGPVAAKRVKLPDGSTRCIPEYEECRAAAQRSGAPVQDVYRAASAAALQLPAH